MSSWPSIAIIGAGMGGLATAAALHRRGIGVTVYEQARSFTRLGAGIQVGCNAMQVLRGLGLEPRLRQEAFYPRSWNNRDAGTGAVRYDQIFGASAERKYGAPYLLAHRGDLHAALASAVPAERIHLGHQVTGLDDDGAAAVLRFADGGSARHDAVVAADGVHSLIRDLLFGRDEVNFTGRIAYRTTFPAALLAGYEVERVHQVVGRGPAHRHLLRQARPERGLLRHQPARTGLHRRVVVGHRRCAHPAGGVRRVPPAGPARAGRLPGRAQVGAGRPRPAAPLA